MSDNAARISELISSLKGWTDAEIFTLREAINDEISRRWLGDGLEAKAKAAEHLHDD